MGSALNCRLKVFIRTFHLLLTVGIFSSLLYFKTELYHAVNTGNVFYWLCFFILVIFATIMYYVACFTNPGYVPLTENNEPKSIIAKSWTGNEDEVSLMVEEQIKLRECGFCGVQQPLRTRHCEDCNRCIRKFDHHCPWLHTCVGEGNHHYFLIFVVSEAIVTAWATIIISQSFEQHQEWTTWLKSNWILLLELFITAGFTFVLTILGGLHSYLMAVNLTTWEMMSRNRITYLKNLDDDLNPFHEGYFCNIYRFLLKNRPRSWEKIYFRNVFSKKACMETWD